MAPYSYTATYDDADRLKTWDRSGSANVPVGTQSWNLDLVGNWNSVTTTGSTGTSTDTRTHTDAHEIATTSIGSNGTLAHDAKGNLTMDASYS